MKILYHCPIAEGGLFEYSKYQAAALADLEGVEVLWHAPASAGEANKARNVRPLAPIELPRRPRGRSKLRRAVDLFIDTVSSYKTLSKAIATAQPDSVLLSAWGEYFSPLWAPFLRGWHNRGVRFAAVIHDPVRDYVRGPVWWHRYSVRQAYSFLDVAFTHDDSPLDTCGSIAPLHTVQLPHGPFPLSNGKASKAELRREFGIPESATVVLSFGHIRDGKNLDQTIAALAMLPSTHLLVAGREQSASQKSAESYQDLARRLGVAERCHWYTDYIPNEEIWRYFRGSDLLLLTYSRDFRSASGVLNVNSQFGLPVVVSAGRSPLLDAVTEYGLGTVILQPDAASIAEAIPQALRLKGEWGRFVEENSWRTNAEKVMAALAA